jgi:PAS domain S-box-containing protein
MQREVRRVETGLAQVVHFFSSGEIISLSGQWKWDLQSDAIFCSDVMIAWPAGLQGTKCIVHPEDVQKVKETVSSERFDIHFRIITTYGEIKTVSGKEIFQVETDPLIYRQFIAWDQQVFEMEWLQRKAEFLHLQKEVYDEAERYGQYGSWYFNTDTFECYYSDGMFRLHKLLPQSLNVHANTFQRFIHAEDAAIVTDSLEKAYKEKVPLHLEFRVVTNDGDTIHVRYIARWKFNEKGHSILYGAYYDVTDQVFAERTIAGLQNQAPIESWKLQRAEELSESGSFEFNIATRKVTFSNGIYRILGLKGNAALNLPMLLKYIHPDDRSLFERTIKNDIAEHTADDLQFRIVRTDGKVRTILRKGNLFITPEGDPLIGGNWQDITDIQINIKQAQKATEELKLQNFLYDRAEEISSIGSWLWDIESGKISFTPNCYRLLNVKQGDTITPEMVKEKLHPEDIKLFNEHLHRIIKKGEDTDFTFRTLHRQQQRHLLASFRMMHKASRRMFVGTLKDVTENYELRQSLTERIGFIETLTESLPDILIVTDIHHNIVVFNKTAEKVYGIKKDDVLHHNIFDVFPQIKRHDILEHLAKSLSGTKVHLPNHPHLLKKGFIDIDLVPIHHADGEVIGVLHYLHDVTKEYALHKQLTQRLAFIERMIEATVDRIVVLDKAMNYQYWNSRAEEFYGLKKEQVVGKNILEIFPQFRNDVSYDQFRQVLKGETIHIPADGKEEEYTETYLIPIKEEGNEVVSILWIVHDLSTEYHLQKLKKEAQERLAEEHRRLKEAQAIGKVGSFEWEVSSGVSHWSDELYRINGLEPQSEEITLDKVDQFIHPADFDAVQQVKERSFHQPGVYKIIHRIVCRNGEVRWVNHEWESIADEDGSVVRVTGIVQDITEQKNAEEEIKKKGELLQATMDSSPEMIQVFKAVRNEQGEIIDFMWVLNNHAAEKQLGDVIGKLLVENNPGVMEEGIFDTFKKVVETGIPDQHERYYVHEQFDGWYIQTAVKMDDGVVTTTVDITLRKKAEEEVQQSKNLLQATIDSTLDIIQVFSAVRDEEGKIIDFTWVMNNKKAITQNGEVIGIRLLDKNPGVIESGIFDKMVQVVETGDALEQEQYYNYEDFDGWYYQALVKSGDGVVMTTRDITQQKKAEQEVLLLKDEIARQAMDKYKALFNSIDEGFAIQEVVTDEKENVIDVIWREVNGAFEQLTGMKDVVGRRVSEFLPHLEQNWLDALTQVYQSGEPLRAENYTADLNRWFTYQYSRIGGTGSPLIAVVFNDITQRKRREEQQEYLLLLNDALRPLTDPVEVQRKAMEVLGTHLKVDRVVYSDINIEDDYFEIHDNYAAGSVQKITGRFPFAAFGASTEKNLRGEILAIHDVNAVVHDDNEKQQFFALNVHAVVAVPLIKEGKLVMNLSVHQVAPRQWRDAEIALIEATAERTWAAVERAKAEAALQKSEKKFRTVFESIDEGFTLIELVRNKEGNVVEFIYRETNETFYLFTGMKDVIGKRSTELMPNLDPSIYQMFQSVADSGKPFRREDYVSDLDRWFDAHYTPINESGSNFIVGVFKEITERKRQELRQTFLLNLSDQFRVLTTADAIAQHAIRSLFEHLHLDRCYVGVYRLEEDLAEFPYQVSNDKVPPLPDSIRLSDFPDALNIALETTLVMNDVAAAEGFSETDKANMSAMGIGSLVAASLRKGDRTPIWSIVTVSATPRNWTLSEIQLIEYVTERTWAAVERAKAEEKLQTANRRLVDVLETTNDAFYSVDADFNFTYVNKKASQFWQTTAESLIGKHYWTTFPKAVGSESYP